MQTDKTPENIKELRDDLLAAYAMLRADPKRLNQAEGLANIAGKALNSVKMEIEYAALRGDRPIIGFLEYGQQRLESNPVKELIAQSSQ